MSEARESDKTSESSAANETVALRSATPDDLAEIWAIEQAVFGAEAWSREMMREELTVQHRHYLVIEDERGAILGYGGVLALGTEGDIQTIALDASARGRGYGRRIMQALLDWAAAQGVREVFLEVRADNSIARGLYVSLGFAEIGVRPRYYQPADIDAVVMRARIGAAAASASAATLSVGLPIGAEVVGGKSHECV